MNKIKVLVSTKETQGQRKNDFSFANKGELLTMGSRCDGARVDDKCGCARSWVGIDTHKATTTAGVIEIEMTPEEYEQKLYISLKNAWGEEAANELGKKDAKEMLRIANFFATGSVLENRNSKVVQRTT